MVKKRLPTREEFEAYEEVRREGRFNMYGPNARLLTGLSRDCYRAVMSNYSELMKKYSDVRNNL